jgi:hypothetical protein
MVCPSSDEARLHLLDARDLAGCPQSIEPELDPLDRSDVLLGHEREHERVLRGREDRAEVLPLIVVQPGAS